MKLHGNCCWYYLDFFLAWALVPVSWMGLHSADWNALNWHLMAFDHGTGQAVWRMQSVAEIVLKAVVEVVFVVVSSER